MSRLDEFRSIAAKLTKRVKRTMGPDFVVESDSIDTFRVFAREMLMVIQDRIESSTMEYLQRTGDSGFASLVFELFLQALWDRWQQPTFHISPALWSRFVLTDPKAVQGDDFHLPFPAFVIVPPPGMLRMINQEGRLLDAAGIMVGKVQAGNGDPVLAIHMLPDIAECNLTLYHRARWPDPEQSVMDALDLTRQRTEPLDMTPEDIDCVYPALRGTINFCVYLRTELGRKDVDLDAPPKRRKRALPGERPTRRFEVGKKIKLSPGLRAAAEKVSRGEPCWELKTGHVVQGHTKRQRYGPGRTLTKLIHVEPYERGPSLNEAAERAYREYDVVPEEETQ